MNYYVTIHNSDPYQISIEDILGYRETPTRKYQLSPDSTRTYSVPVIQKRVIDRTNFDGMYIAIAEFVEKYADLIAANKSDLYRHFSIPKRSGGLRKIDAPLPPLMEALVELKGILERKFMFTHHASAYAYVRGRSTIAAVQRHQTNKSRWFLKTDLHSFFNSSSIDFVLDMLYKTYPLCEYIKRGENYKQMFESALSLCFLDGGLPQGTPTSPMITNQMMIPIDFEIAKMCREYTPHLCMTRYADDIHISSEFNFMWSDVQGRLIAILNAFGAPFEINKEKTHYGSNSGRNWILGVMYNQNNDITIGHEKKKVCKAMIHQFMNNFISGTPWSLEDTQHLAGLLSYYRMVEPEWTTQTLAAYTTKFHKDVMGCIKEILKQC